MLEVQAVEILKGEQDYEQLVKQKRRSLKRTYSVELYDAEEYNSTKYLSDVDHLMQIALEIWVMIDQDDIGYRLYVESMKCRSFIE